MWKSQTSSGTPWERDGAGHCRAVARAGVGLASVEPDRAVSPADTVDFGVLRAGVGGDELGELRGLQKMEGEQVMTAAAKPKYQRLFCSDGDSGVAVLERGSVAIPISWRVENSIDVRRNRFRRAPLRQ